MLLSAKNERVITPAAGSLLPFPLPRTIPQIPREIY